ncbi:unnamed protein product [Bodo saltans]|uniref:Uncharacterized protein n=1 Tax=Bodo saltans TaxID=75058 RepID=A0A0S4J759_BODSA|nr:unnamed protein product [Bodo saltans]|eukprot:CUG74331.1 unnamed protein product [Bodo saltans]
MGSCLSDNNQTTHNCDDAKSHHGLVPHPPTTPTSCSSLTASVLPFPSHRTAAGTTDVSTSRIAVTDLLNGCDASNDRPPPVARSSAPTTTKVVPSRTVPSQSSHPQAAPLGPFVPLTHKNSADCFHSRSARVNPLASLRCDSAICDDVVHKICCTFCNARLTEFTYADDSRRLNR